MMTAATATAAGGGTRASHPSSSRVPLPPFSNAFPVFLLGAVVVLVIYQLRLGWHQAVRTGDDYEALQMFRKELPDEQQLAAEQQVVQPVQQDTLVVYIYNEDDAVYKQNFQHFLVAGVQPNSR